MKIIHIDHEVNKVRTEMLNRLTPISQAPFGVRVKTFFIGAESQLTCERGLPEGGRVRVTATCVRHNDVEYFVRWGRMHKRWGIVGTDWWGGFTASVCFVLLAVYTELKQWGCVVTFGLMWSMLLAFEIRDQARRKKIDAMEDEGIC